MVRYTLFNPNGTQAGQFPNLQSTMDAAQAGMYAFDNAQGMRWVWTAFYASAEYVAALVGQWCDSELEARYVAAQGK